MIDDADAIHEWDFPGELSSIEVVIIYNTKINFSSFLNAGVAFMLSVALHLKHSAEIPN